jgi:hypothetical protein
MTQFAPRATNLLMRGAPKGRLEARTIFLQTSRLAATVAHTPCVLRDAANAAPQDEVRWVLQEGIKERDLGPLTKGQTGS